MRTTLTLDDDVAVGIDKIRKASGESLRAVVNDALRAGLRQMEQPPPGRKVVRTRPMNLGRTLVGSLDDVAEALAVAEGEAYR